MYISKITHGISVTENLVLNPGIARYKTLNIQPRENVSLSFAFFAQRERKLCHDGFYVMRVLILGIDTILKGRSNQKWLDQRKGNFIELAEGFFSSQLQSYSMKLFSRAVVPAAHFLFFFLSLSLAYTVLMNKHGICNSCMWWLNKHYAC